MNPNEIPTPRTENAKIYNGGIGEYIPLEFARTLERELHMAREKVTELESYVTGNPNYILLSRDEIEKMECECKSGLFGKSILKCSRCELLTRF